MPQPTTILKQPRTNKARLNCHHNTQVGLFNFIRTGNVLLNGMSGRSVLPLIIDVGIATSILRRAANSREIKSRRSRASRRGPRTLPMCAGKIA
eukprot:scaffold165986_cov38-Prasinocladus_malaysianus.AAC.1